MRVNVNGSRSIYATTPHRMYAYDSGLLWLAKQTFNVYALSFTLLVLTGALE
ncbi:MAG: hypothetical protein V3Q69_02380 [Burkholderia sp.]